MPSKNQYLNSYNICIDKTYSDFENEIIKDQFKIWQYKINNKVTFKFKPNCEVDIKSFMANRDDIMFINFDKHNNFIEELDKYQDPGILTVGVYHYSEVRFIGLMTFRINSYDQFKKVTLHEIGHLLGLNHGNKNTIMFKHLGSQPEELTDSDIKQFCQIYGC